MDQIPESAEIFFSKALFGPLLDTEDRARAFAVFILSRLHGEAEVIKQKPLRVVDQDPEWLISGSYQEVGKLPGTGMWFIRVRKSDCRVVGHGHWQPLDSPGKSSI